MEIEGVAVEPGLDAFNAGSTGCRHDAVLGYIHAQTSKTLKGFAV
ncbi:hypothetical protein [Mesorhizobium sp. M0751]